MGVRITGCFCKAIKPQRTNESQGVSFDFMPIYSTLCFSLLSHEVFCRNLPHLFGLHCFHFCWKSKAALIASDCFGIKYNTTFPCKDGNCLNGVFLLLLKWPRSFLFSHNNETASPQNAYAITNMIYLSMTVYADFIHHGGRTTGTSICWRRKSRLTKGTASYKHLFLFLFLFFEPTSG